MSLAHSVGAAEYTVYISTKTLNFTNECYGYNIKQSDGEAQIGSVAF